MILVADSGSTKTEWITEQLTVTTNGINPVRDSEEDISRIVSTELMPSLYAQQIEVDSITEIHFYGAGCIEPFSASVLNALKQQFTHAEIRVYSDLLGAARALCAKSEGIACILGTGSNSCYCKDGEIVSNTSPMGYILGDEGSGAVLGKLLISEMLKGDLRYLWNQFSEEYSLSTADIINNVYRKPLANKYLASFVPFIKRNLDKEGVREMVVEEFCRFLRRNVVPYNRPDLPINFVGGVANNFSHEIKLACQRCGLVSGKFIERPAIEMLKYHFYVF